MGLDSVISMLRAEKGLVEQIAEGLANANRAEKVEPPTPDKWYRVSGLAYLCPREEILACRKQVTRESPPDPDLTLTFAHGTGLHHAVQNCVLGPLDMIYGDWLCLSCGAFYGCRVLRPRSCAACGHAEFLFREETLVDEELKLSGHPDGFLVSARMTGKGLLEVKSISDWGFKAVKNVPNVAHVVQMQMYMKMAQLDWGRTLYWSKGKNGISALLSHFVERDEDTIRGVESMVVGMREGMRTGKLPERICKHAECDRAESCQLRDLCFTYREEVP